MRHLKAFLAVLGFSLAAAGIALDQRPLVWAAIAILASSLALRLWLRRRGLSERKDSA
jgi:hypothetical protein